MSVQLALPYQPANIRPTRPHRPVSKKRVNGLRTSWFVIGSMFGIGLSLALNLVITRLVLPEYSRLISENDPGTRAAEFNMSSVSLGSLEPTAGEDTQDAPANDGLPSPALPYPREMTLKVGNGDTLIDMLTREQVDYDEAVDAVEALGKSYNPRSLQKGQKINVRLEQHPDLPGKAALAELSIRLGPTDSIELSRLAGGSFSVEKAKKTLSPELTYAGGSITNSLFETGYANGIPQGVLAELVKAYSYDIDFQREIKRGDKMGVLFERMTTQDGDAAGYGKIFYAMLNVHGKPMKLYRYEGKDGTSGFYNEKGESIVKALLKTPINGARISSSFGMRMHPILGYSKMHRGTDFAASTGTPIYAAGDGIISYVGPKSGYGNYVEIRHNGMYSTAYAHMNAFARGIRPGSAVRQGQVIGSVGATGRTTGPHLHYEVHKYNVQVNPMDQKFKTGKVLAGNEMTNFKRYINKIETQVASLNKNGTTKLASRH